jgi:hypothetical protein
MIGLSPHDWRRLLEALQVEGLTNTSPDNRIIQIGPISRFILAELRNIALLGRDFPHVHFVWLPGITGANCEANKARCFYGVT